MKKASLCCIAGVAAIFASSFPATGKPCLRSQTGSR